MEKLGTRVVVTLISIVLAGIPTWIYFIANHLLAPNGFWQKLAVLGASYLLLGTIQFFLLIGLAMWLAIVWTD